MQIGPVAARTGVNVETIRYYERIGLLPKPARSEGGWRVYTKADEQRLSFIRRSRELGFSIEDVEALIALGAGDNSNCAEVFELSCRHLVDIRRKIADLRRMERVLKTMAASCAEGTLPHCPIIEVLSASAR